jgi:tRNA (guanine37-N1)-methyltransferase
MIRFDVITIFPEILKSYVGESLIARAQAKKLIKINLHDLRKWGKGPHKQVDDRPFGGGLGMVMQFDPIAKAIKKIKAKNKQAKVIFFTPRGKKFNQQMASKLAKLDQIIFICGRYEGVDERVAKNIADMEISIGEYDLMGGELPAMILIESISRLVPGVLGKPALLAERVSKTGGFLEYMQYTRPEVIKYNGKKLAVPKVLLSGDHKKIKQWKDKHGKVIEK